MTRDLALATGAALVGFALGVAFKHLFWNVLTRRTA